MRQRLDIAEIEERTKIRAKYLRALENEEWSLLPGPTFVRTFLRTYAEAVGVDPYPLVEAYRQSHEAGDSADFQPLAPLPQRDRRRQGRRPPPRPPRRGRWIAVAVAVAVLALLLVLGLTGGDDGGDRGGGEATVATETTAAPSAQERRAARRERRRPQRRKAAATGVAARVVPADPTYVCVDRGPGTEIVFEGTLTAPRSFRDGSELRLNLGLRTAMVTVGGEPVAIEPGGEPVALAITRAGATEIDATEAPCA